MQSPSLPRMPSLSVVIPVFNERGNIGPLVQEVVYHLRGKIAFDITPAKGAAVKEEEEETA